MFAADPKASAQLSDSDCALAAVELEGALAADHLAVTQDARGEDVLAEVDVRGVAGDVDGDARSLGVQRAADVLVGQLVVLPGLVEPVEELLRRALHRLGLGREALEHVAAVGAQAPVLLPERGVGPVAQQVLHLRALHRLAGAVERLIDLHVPGDRPVERPQRVHRLALLDRDAELERVGAGELRQAPVVLLGRERESGLVVGRRVGLGRAGGHVVVVHRAGRPVERREHALVELGVVVWITDGVVGLAVALARLGRDVAGRVPAAAVHRAARGGDEVLHEAEVLGAAERLALLEPDLRGLCT